MGFTVFGLLYACHLQYSWRFDEGYRNAAKCRPCDLGRIFTVLFYFIDLLKIYFFNVFYYFYCFYTLSAHSIDRRSSKHVFVLVADGTILIQIKYLIVSQCLFGTFRFYRQLLE